MKPSPLQFMRHLDFPGQNCNYTSHFSGQDLFILAVFFLSPSDPTCFGYTLTFLRVFFPVPSQRCDVLVRQASIFLTDDEEFLLELSRLHWKTFKENVWKRRKQMSDQLNFSRRVQLSTTWWGYWLCSKTKIPFLVTRNQQSDTEEQALVQTSVLNERLQSSDFQHRRQKFPHQKPLCHVWKGIVMTSRMEVMLSDAGNLSGVARGNERLKRSSLLSGTPAIRALFSEIEVEKEQTHCVALRFCSSVGV